MRILIFGDGAWATNSILRLRESEHAIVGLVARVRPSDPLLLDAAKSLAIPIFQPASANSDEFMARVRLLAPDIIFSISYDQILRQPLLSAARLGSLNVHAGKLPYYRGRNVINWAIINGESEIGLTVHFMDEGIDTGDIILQATRPIYWTDTYREVLDRVVEAIPDMVVEAINLVAHGLAKSQPQSQLAGTYFCSRGEGDEWLDWADSSLNLYNKVRAITRPGPGARTMMGERVVTIWCASYEPEWPKYIATPGQVIGRQNEGVLVKTGDSTILLREVQAEGAAVETPSWPIGTRLGLNPFDMIRSLQTRIKELEDNLKQSGKTYGAGSPG